MGVLKVRTLADVARLFGVNRRTLHDWREQLGAPLQKADGYDATALVAWRLELERSRLLGDEVADSDDPEMTRWKRKLVEERARIAELDRKTRESDLVELDRLRPWLLRTANLIRGSLERLQREFGQEAVDIVTEALDEAERQLDEGELEGED